MHQFPHLKRTFGKYSTEFAAIIGPKYFSLRNVAAGLEDYEMIIIQNAVCCCSVSAR